MLGFDRADIARIRAEKQRAEARQRIADLMAPTPKDDPALTQDEDGGGDE